MLQQRGDGQALQAVALMQQGQIVDLTAAIALSAAKASIERRLPMADSIILVTAQTHGAAFWTQDVDFEGVEGVKYVARNAPG